MILLKWFEKITFLVAKKTKIAYFLFFIFIIFGAETLTLPGKFRVASTS